MSAPNPKTSRWIDWPTRVLEWLCIGAMFALVLDVLWGVASRFVLRTPARWTDELATFLLIWVAMLGAAVSHRHGGHLGVRWLLERVEAPAGTWVVRFIHLAVILFAAIVMVYGGIVLVQDRYDAGQVLPALGWSKAWVYLAVPVAGVFIIVYSVCELIWPSPLTAEEPEANII